MESVESSVRRALEKRKQGEKDLARALQELEDGMEMLREMRKSWRS